MTIIDILSESEIQQGWRFRIRVGEGRAATEHLTDLSWVDYDYWCGGAAPPERVAAAVVRFLLERDPDAALPEHFDASIIRRRFPDLDARLRELI